MKDTIGLVMRACRQYFPADWTDGVWTLKDGVISPEMPDGLIAVTGSMMHNGVWMVQSGRIDTEKDETWEGRVWRLAPPGDFLALCEEIDAWREKHPAQAIRSEKFGEYSVEMAAGRNGAPVEWQTAFAQQLRMYQKMYAEVDVTK